MHRNKVQELYSKEYSQKEISQILLIGLAKVNRDISYLRNQAKTNVRKYIDERNVQNKKSTLMFEREPSEDMDSFRMEVSSAVAENFGLQ